jgi:ribonuclease HII
MASQSRGAATTSGLGHEWALTQAGCLAIAGVDEAGRGAWAGPLVAAAVVLPVPSCADDADLLARLAGVRDSKALSADQREHLFPAIVAAARGVGIGTVPADELDRIGLGPANRLAWARAIGALPLVPDYLLLDAFRLPGVSQPQTPLVRGERESLSIAAASIVAKVHRDRLLHALDGEFPRYGFARHKGYGTAAHLAALLEHGPCLAHRFSFGPVYAVQLRLPIPEPVR